MPDSITESDPRVGVTAQLPLSMRRRLDAMARAKHLSRSAVVEDLLEFALESVEGEEGEGQ